MKLILWDWNGTLLDDTWLCIEIANQMLAARGIHVNALRVRAFPFHSSVSSFVASHDFAIPEAYVDRQIEMTVQNQLRQLASQGVDPSKLNLDWSKVKEAQGERARKDVRASLLLDKIGERESIAATNDEVDAEVARIARQQRETVPVTKAKLQKDGTLSRIAGHIRTEKTLKLLFDEAKKSAPKAKD